MSALELLLIGALGFMVYKAVTTDNVTLSIDAALESYFTPFNPGIVQDGWIKLFNDSEKAVSIAQLIFKISDKQITQSAKEVFTSSLANNPLTMNLSYGGKRYHSKNDKITLTPADLDLNLPAHASLGFDMQVQAVMYTPVESPIVVTANFDRTPFICNIDVEVILTNGDVMKLTMPVPFSNVKQEA